MYKDLDEYLNDIFPFPCSSKLIEIRKEFKNHLEEALNDFVLKGFTEEESLQKAIINFGDAKSLKVHIKKLNRNNKRNKRILFALGTLLLLTLCSIKILSLPLFLMFVTVVCFGFLASLGAVINFNHVTNKNEALKDANNIAALGGLGIRYKKDYDE